MATWFRRWRGRSRSVCQSKGTVERRMSLCFQTSSRFTDYIREPREAFLDVWLLRKDEPPPRSPSRYIGFAVVLHVCTRRCEILMCRKRKVLLAFGPFHVSVPASGLTCEVRSVRHDLRGCRKLRRLLHKVNDSTMMTVFKSRLLTAERYKTTALPQSNLFMKYFLLLQDNHLPEEQSLDLRSVDANLDWPVLEKPSSGSPSAWC